MKALFVVILLSTSVAFAGGHRLICKSEQPDLTICKDKNGVFLLIENHFSEELKKIDFAEASIFSNSDRSVLLQIWNSMIFVIDRDGSRIGLKCDRPSLERCP